MNDIETQKSRQPRAEPAVGFAATTVLEELLEEHIALFSRPDGVYRGDPDYPSILNGIRMYNMTKPR